MSKFIVSKFPKKDNKRMSKNLIRAMDAFIGLTAIAIFVLAVVFASRVNAEEELPEVKAEPIVEEVEEVIVATTELVEPKEPIVSDEEIIAMVVHAEAQGEPMIGKVAVACVVYNRADRYGLTVESVVNAKHQFSISDSYTEEDLRAVEIARDNRDLYPENMLYFRADAYHTFGSRWLPIGNHYFSLESEDN